MKTSLFLTTGLLVACFAAAGAQAKTLKVEEQVEINAPAAKVWEKISNFGDMSWHPAVAKDEITSGTNNKQGAVRLLTLQDGGTIKEQLDAYHARGHSYQYRILEGVLPVSHYRSTITVKAAGKDKATVVWTGHFKRKDTSAAPAAGSDDETAVKAITGVYRGGLDNLKKISE